MSGAVTPTEDTFITLPEPVGRLVESGALAHVVSLDPDGSPHVTGVWVGTDHGDIVFASMYAWRKTKNLMRDPRTAISIETQEFHESGLREYVTLRGRVEVTEGGAFALLRRLAKTYMGPDAVFPPDELGSRTGYVMRLKLEQVGGVGPWTAGPPGLPEKSGEKAATT